ncbi:MAG: DHA2 family efflux MFS transporter permease subunit [Hyphomicrobiaceae bacterium]
MTATTAEPGLMSITARQWFILLMVQLCTMLFGMTITLANVVLPQIKGAMAATQEEIAWVVTFNLVATAVATPLSGWLASRFGWRLVMVTSVAGFTIFSFLCGIATSLETLVVFRIGQGIFGAPIMPMGQGILLATFPRHLHAMVMMIWGIGGVIGPVTGPFLGSMVSEAYNWRWAFFMIVPPGILATASAWFALMHHNERQPRRFDWTGFMALAIAIAAAQFVMDRGQRLDWLDSTEIVVAIIVAALALWVFVIHTFTAEEPFFNPRLLLDRNYSLGLLIAAVMGMLMFTPMVLFPGLLHDLRGYPDDLIGALLAGRGIGNWLSFLIIVPFTRRNPRLALACGMLAQAVSGFAMAQLDINVTNTDVFWTNLLQGFGFGLAFTPMSVLAFATLPPRQMTEGMAFFHLVRNFGSSLFISISVVLLIRSTAINYAGLTENISLYNKVLAMPGALGMWTLETPRGLVSLAGEIKRQATMIGYINAFYLFAFTATASIPLAYLMRDVPRSTP